MVSPIQAGDGLSAEAGLEGGPRTSSLLSEAILRLISLLAFGRGCSEAPITLGIFMPLTLPDLWRGLLTSRVYLEDEWPSHLSRQPPSRTGPCCSWSLSKTEALLLAFPHGLYRSFCLLGRGQEGLTDGVIHSTKACGTFSVLGAGMDITYLGSTQVLVKKGKEPIPEPQSGREASATSALRGKARKRFPRAGD